MSPFEYLLLFAAVILGLAISELALASHRLVSASDRVEWDWLSPMAATVIFLKIVTQWWSWYAAQFFPGGLRFEMFIAVVLGGVLLFLLSATALPEARHDDGVLSLAKHYERVQRRFWILFSIHWVIVTAVSTWIQVEVGGAHFSPWSPIFLLAPASITLAFVRSRWLHTLALMGLIWLYVGQFYGQQLVKLSGVEH